MGILPSGMLMCGAVGSSTSRTSLPVAKQGLSAQSNSTSRAVALPLILPRLQ